MAVLTTGRQHYLANFVGISTWFWSYQKLVCLLHLEYGVCRNVGSYVVDTICPGTASPWDCRKQPSKILYLSTWRLMIFKFMEGRQKRSRMTFFVPIRKNWHYNSCNFVDTLFWLFSILQELGWLVYTRPDVACVVNIVYEVAEYDFFLQTFCR